MIGREDRLFDSSLFREYIRIKLTALLDSIPGKKMLMMDRTIMTALTFVDPKLIYDHGVVKEGGFLPYQPISINTNFNQLVMVVPPTQRSMELFVQLYQLNCKKDLAYYLVFCPKKSHACTEYLESRGLFEMVIIKDFSYGLLPYDHDLYSLEMKCFRELYLLADQSIYSVVAESIIRLESVYGRVRNIHGKGAAAKFVFDILKIKEQQYRVDPADGDIEHLIIFDRTVDLLTPLLKPFTYQAMVDEVYGIASGYAKIPKQQPSRPTTAPTPQFDLVQMSTEKDNLYSQIRWLNVSAAMKILRGRVGNLENLRKETENIKDSKRLQEKSQNTERYLSQKNLINTHVNLCSALMDQMKTIGFYKEVSMVQRCIMGEGEKEIPEYYDNLVCFGQPLEKLLRPLCIYSIVEKGIHKKMFRPLATQIAQCYGAESIITLSSLAKLGMFNEQGSSQFVQSSFAQLRKDYKLVSRQAINHDNPTDICFAYGGYTPITVKLVEQVARGGWKAIPKIMRLIPGQVVQPESIRPCTSTNRPVILVYYVGGVTFGEVAALRLLGKLLGREMVVLTTEILNGDSLLRSIMEPRN